MPALHTVQRAAHQTDRTLRSSSRGHPLCTQASPDGSTRPAPRLNRPCNGRPIRPCSPVSISPGASHCAHKLHPAETPALHPASTDRATGAPTHRIPQDAYATMQSGTRTPFPHNLHTFAGSHLNLRHLKTTRALPARLPCLTFVHFYITFVHSYITCVSTNMPVMTSPVIMSRAVARTTRSAAPSPGCQPSAIPPPLASRPPGSQPCITMHYTPC